MKEEITAYLSAAGDITEDYEYEAWRDEVAQFINILLGAEKEKEFLEFDVANPEDAISKSLRRMKGYLAGNLLEPPTKSPTCLSNKSK